MAGRFSIRFNLHNSPSSIPTTAEVFEKIWGVSASEAQHHLDDFELIQRERISRLKQKYPSETEKLRGKSVLFLGDSITSDNLGYRASVTRAAELIARDASVSGAVSPMMLYSARTFIAEKKPDIVSLMIGGNDSVYIDKEDLCQVSLSEYERNIRQIAEWTKRRGSALLLFEVTPCDEERFANSFTPEHKFQTNSNIARYNEVLQKIAESYGIKLISNAWVKGNSDMFEPDGIHLSVSAHERFAENWLVEAAKLF